MFSNTIEEAPARRAHQHFSFPLLSFQSFIFPVLSYRTFHGGGKETKKKKKAIPLLREMCLRELSLCYDL